MTRPTVDLAARLSLYSHTPARTVPPVPARWSPTSPPRGVGVAAPGRRISTPVARVRALRVPLSVHLRREARYLRTLPAGVVDYLGRDMRLDGPALVVSLAALTFLLGAACSAILTGGAL